MSKRKKAKLTDELPKIPVVPGDFEYEMKLNENTDSVVEMIKEVPKIEFPVTEEKKDELPSVPLPVQEPNSPQLTSQVITPPLNLDDVRKNGEDFGEGIIVIAEAISGEILADDKCRIVKERFGAIATRHPNWFADSNVADVIDSMTILGVLSPLLARGFNKLAIKVMKYREEVLKKL